MSIAAGSICSKVSAWIGDAGPYKDPPAAAQPIKGGTPPTTAPTHVLISDFGLRDVYAPAYKAMFPTARADATGSKTASADAPAPPATPAKVAANSGEQRPDGRGRFRVRAILASLSVSRI